MLPLDVLLKLKRRNTPTIYNGWEQITRRPRTTGFNLEETRDFMPEFGPMGEAASAFAQAANAALGGEGEWK